jgi:hypothetical protein
MRESSDKRAAALRRAIEWGVIGGPLVLWQSSCLAALNTAVDQVLRPEAFQNALDLPASGLGSLAVLLSNLL